jgi:putative membrane protein
MSISPLEKRSLREYFYITFCGMCMGAADIVPGISGGTIAFIMGFYKELLMSIKSIKFKSLFSSPPTKFLAFLLSGILFSILLLAPIFDRILNQETYRIYLYSGFLGLILASISLCFKEIKAWSASLFFGLLIGGISAFILTSIEFTLYQEGNLYNVPIVINHDNLIKNYDPVNKTLTHIPQSSVGAMLAKGIIEKDAVIYNMGDQTTFTTDHFKSSNKKFVDWWIILCGSIAVCALLLPGISGSYLLTILGSYPVVIGAMADFTHAAKQLKFDEDAFVILSSLCIGILIGAVVFSRTVLFLLKHYHDLTIAIMTGFMIGALQSVWPFWSYSYFLNPLSLHKGPLLKPEYPTFPPIDSTLIPCLLFTIAGCGLVFLVEYLAKRTRVSLNTCITTG